MATDPGWTAQSVGLIEWVLGAAWAVAMAIGGLMVKSFSGMRRKVDMLEIDVAKIEVDLAAMEKKVDERHRENTTEFGDLRDVLRGDMRDLRQRIDRLLDRSLGHGGGLGAGREPPHG